MGIGLQYTIDGGSSKEVHLILGGFLGFSSRWHIHVEECILILQAICRSPDKSKISCRAQDTHALYAIMGCMRDIRKRAERTEASFTPMGETVRPEPTSDT